MKQRELLEIYQSLDQFELNILQCSREQLEQSKKIRFANLQAYIGHLSMSIMEQQSEGKFVPRNIHEAQAGCYLC